MPKKTLESYKRELEKLENIKDKSVTEKRNETRFKNIINKLEKLSEAEKVNTDKVVKLEKKILKDSDSLKKDHKELKAYIKKVIKKELSKNL